MHTHPLIHPSPDPASKPAVTRSPQRNKGSKPRLLALLLLVLAVLLQVSAFAYPSYQTGDLLLGFRATGTPGVTQDFVVDIGPLQHYVNATGSFTVTGLGNIAADLLTVFGSSWNTRSDVFWGIVGTDYDGGTVTTPTLYVTRQRNAPGTPATPWKGRSVIAQTSTVTLFQQLTGEFKTEGGVAGGVGSTNSPVAVIQNTVDAGKNAYASFTKPTLTTDFNVWNTIQGNFGNGTAGTVLELFQVNPVLNQNAVSIGTFNLSDGGVLTFTPTTSTAISGSAPTPTTGTATGISTTAAVLTGAVIPNGLSTTAYFDYGTSGTYGSSTSGTAVGSGSATVPVSIPLAALTPNTTYYFRLTASNSAGINYGAQQSFATNPAPAPTATTGSATGATGVSALLHASVDANPSDVTAYFESGTDTSYGTVTSLPTVTASATTTAVSGTVTDLLPNTTYYFRIVVANTSGTAYGNPIPFSTNDQLPPTVATGSVNGITDLSAVVSGWANPNGILSGAFFEYGPTTVYGLTAGAQTIGSGSAAIPLSATLPGLSPNTQYYFRLTATNSVGSVSGTAGVFRTAAPPPVPTLGSVSVSPVAATAAGISVVAQSNGTDTSVYFQFGKSTGYGLTTGAVALAADAPASLVSVTIPRLSPHTTYYVRAVATSAAGTSLTNPTVFKTRARGDLNGDGYADLVTVKTANRASVVYFQKNGRMVGSSAASPKIPASLTFVGQADFYGDGNPDWALFSASTHQLQIWRLNGTVRTSASALHIPPGYAPIGVGDFDGDGQSDLLVSNTTSRHIEFWILNGTTLVRKIRGSALPAGFTVAAVEDINGDGKPDLVLWNAKTGQTKVWLLNGTSLLTAIDGPTISAGWKLITVDEFKNDETGEWLVFNPSTRATQLWKVRGKQRLSATAGPKIPVGLDLIGTH